MSSLKGREIITGGSIIIPNVHQNGAYDHINDQKGQVHQKADFKGGLKLRNHKGRY